MKSIKYVPDSLRTAAGHVRGALRRDPRVLPKSDFVKVWSAVAYLFPGLHPDGFELRDSGWPRVIKRFAAEAWRRAEAGELSDEELYPCDAQWSGLYDRMTVHYPEETSRRLKIARSSLQDA
jgi:hypothetical protein